jgi:dTMP kinase
VLSAAPGRLPLLRNAYAVIATAHEAPTERVSRPVVSPAPQITA